MTLMRSILALALCSALTPLFARDASYEQAQVELRSKNYDAAITYFRKYLRKFSNDYDTWSLLGASYYHAGQPERSLKNLKKVERRVMQRSFNFFYQGQCYLTLGRIVSGKRFLSYAARYGDEYAARAVFELAVLEYQAQNAAAAAYWADQYLKRFSSSPSAGDAQKLAESVKAGTVLKEVKNSEKTDTDDALFHHSKYSLLDSPHFWHIQSGYGYEQGTVTNPRFGRGLIPEIKQEGYQKHLLKLNPGFGLGPLKSNNAVANFGYFYFQDWNTDQDRLSDWFESPSNFSIFPFRPDLLERRHHLFTDFTKYFSDTVYFAVTGIFDISRVGSALFASDGNADLKKVLNTQTVALIIPSVGIKYNGHETNFYLYFRKELNDESPDLSNKSYNLFLETEEKMLSYGLSQKLVFPSIRTRIDAELFEYEYIYNDYWLDYSRTGLVAKVENEFMRGFYVHAVAGAYTDVYPFAHIRLAMCKFGESPPEDSELVKCIRKDEGLLYQVGMSWRWSQFERLSGYYGYMSNSNPILKVFEQTRSEFVATYTFAFPSIDRVLPFIERFGDIASTKNND